MTAKKLVSIIIPARNEEETIGHVLLDVQKTIRRLQQYHFEVLVVNDHSADKTAAIAKAHSATVVENLKRSGKGNALVSGFNAARGNIIIMMDADGSHIASEIPLFLERLERGCGLVVGSRTLGGSEEYTPIRAFGNVLITFTFKICFAVTCTDILNGYKAFKKEVIQNHRFTSRGFEIEIELAAEALRRGFRICEVVSHEKARAGGQMKSMALRQGFWFLLKILTERVRHSDKGGPCNLTGDTHHG